MNKENEKNNTLITPTVKKQMRHLLTKFITLRNQGYIKSTAKGTSGVGITFENYLGKKADSSSTPDYYDIEIKTKRAYSKSFITLFGISPHGKTTNEAQRILNDYGYHKKNHKYTKCLYSEVTSTTLSTAGIKHYLKLRLDYNQKCIFLQIYNQQKQLIDENSYWLFSDIESRLTNKLSYMAYILAWPKFINGEEYFKYYDIKFYILKDFYNFLDLLENGHIKIIIALNSTIENKNLNQLQAHKISFALDPTYLPNLFYAYHIKKDILI